MNEFIGEHAISVITWLLNIAIALVGINVKLHLNQINNEHRDLKEKDNILTQGLEDLSKVVNTMKTNVVVLENSVNNIAKALESIAHKQDALKNEISEHSKLDSRIEGVVRLIAHKLDIPTEHLK